MKLQDFADPESPNHQIKALLLPAQVITQANVDDVVKAGALTQADICKGITTECAAIGLQ